MAIRNPVKFPDSFVDYPSAVAFPERPIPGTTRSGFYLVQYNGACTVVDAGRTGTTKFIFAGPAGFALTHSGGGCPLNGANESTYAQGSFMLKHHGEEGGFGDIRQRIDFAGGAGTGQMTLYVSAKYMGPLV